MAYVYLHTRLDTNEIFYVGIGNSDDNNFKRSRSKESRNKYWKNIVNKAGYRVDVVYRNISWENACEIEMKLIKLYGRSDLGLGNLVNMTDGGEGSINISDESKAKMRGRKLSDETKAKMSKAKKGKPAHNKGKKMTSEQIAKMSIMLKGRTTSEETKLKLSEAQKNRNSERNQFNYNQIIHFMNLGLTTKEISIIINLCVSSINRLKNKLKNNI